jgi:membrane peptidoglycan carboxypeptidase
VYPAPECIALPDAPGLETCGGTGRPETLLEATVESLNPVFVQVVDRIGVDGFGSVAEALGIKSGADYARVDAVLGTYPASVLEMAGAYRAISAGGEYVSPHLAVDVEGADEAPAVVLSASVWSDVDLALHQVIERGTGMRADPGRDAAGKTGTAIGFTDAWFVGYTDEIVAAVWVGFADDADRSMVFPATSAVITGGSLPAELWAAIAVGPAG